MAATRIHFIDRLRVVMTVLVIAHHSAITYGASGSWFYREPGNAASPTVQLLTMFVTVNQAFFMGMFFLLAGYYTPVSLAAKGASRWAADRLLRLGMPLLAFGLVLGPLAVALAGLPQGRPVLATWLAMMGHGDFVIGPLWFAWALLLFSAGWLLWRWWRRVPVPLDAPVPGHRAWLSAAVAVGAAALAMRQLVPVGQNLWGLQLGYFAAYLFLFVLGCVAGPQRWLERLPPAQVRVWRRVSWCALPVLLLTAAATGALQGRAVNFSGGLGLPAVVYAFWEPFVAWGLIAALLLRFQVRWNAPSRHWQAWAAQAYGAFVLHAPVIVALAVLLADWPLPPGVKFLLLGTLGTVLSFSLAGLLRRLPGVQRVL